MQSSSDRELLDGSKCWPDLWSRAPDLAQGTGIPLPAWFFFTIFIMHIRSVILIPAHIESIVFLESIVFIVFIVCIVIIESIVFIVFIECIVIIESIVFIVCIVFIESISKSIGMCCR